MKKHLRYFLTLLLVMVASVGWADTYTIGWGTASGDAGTYTNFAGTGGTVDGIVSYITEKNSSTANPAYNEKSNELRLYYNAQGNGGSITLTPAEGITITGIVMTTSTSPSVNYFVDGGTATNITASDNTYTISGISATSSLKIQNANTSNTQLRIKTIAITYSSSSGSSTVATPTFSPVAGTYNDAQNVTISTTTTDATIYYTIDGTDPTTTSSVYSAAIPVTENTTIKAYAVKDGLTDSEIATAEYVINYKVATPTFTPAAGTYNEAQNVTITTETDGATIYYTIDGTDPTTESNLYSEAVSITETTTLKAIAVKEGMTDSEIATAEYTIVDTGNWVFDELTYDLIGVSGTSYTTWSGKSTNSSSAVYAGNSAGGNESIQLRSTSNSGIVTTKSGGKAKQVVVIWNSNTASGRTLDVYGKNTAYSTAADLYSYDNKGDKLGSIAYGETTLTIEGDYEYIGVRSYSGAMYLDAVKIAWEPDTTAISVTIGETEYATLYYSDVNLTVPEGVTAKTYKANGTALVELDNYSAGDVIPAGTGVVLNGAQGDYTFAISAESGTATDGSMLRGSDEEAMTTGGAKYYMLSLAATGGNETVGFYYGATDGAAFTNKAHRAYLAVPEGTEAKATGYAFNEVTGINDITREQVTDGVWYTIDGKRLNGEPTVKGIYVVNGKKVVIK